MFKIVMMFVVMFGSDSTKQESPREKREAAIKAVKEKIAPLEKKLEESKEDLEATKKTPVIDRPSTGRNIAKRGESRIRTSNFNTQQEKQKFIDLYTARIEAATEQLKPLQAELKELQKPPKLEKK